MRDRNRLTCSRCEASFPNVAIVRCKKSVPGGLILCRSCHKRFHPSCDQAVPAVRPEDRLCDHCLCRLAVYVCPQCSDRSRVCLQLCSPCSARIHTDLRAVHLDHIQAMPP